MFGIKMVGRVAGLMAYLFAESLGTCILAAAQEIPVPPLSRGDHSGWTLDRGRGDISELKRLICLRVEGDGTEVGSNVWLSSPLPLEPGHLYTLEFRSARGEKTSGGCAVAGTTHYNVDLNDLGTTLQKRSLIFRAAWEKGPKLRFGQWSANGPFYFCQFSLHRVVPVYTRSGDLILGAGEHLMGLEYHFVHPMGETQSNDCRPLRQFNAPFNTNRFVFSEGKYLIFEHQLNGRSFTEANVYVWSTAFDDGVLGIGWSLDGKNWSETQQVKPGQRVSAPLAGLSLPAERIFIRLSGHGSGSVQVTGYRFQARVDGQPVDAKGDTLYAKILELPEETDAALDPVDFAADEGTMTLRLTRNSRPLALPLKIRCDKTPPVRGTVGRPFKIPVSAGMHKLSIKGARLAVDLNYRISPYRDYSGGELLNKADGLWWTSSGWKIPPDRPLPQKKGKAVRVSLAGNEAEAVQVVLCPPRTLEGLRVSTTGLTAPDGAVLPASAVEIRQVRYVRIVQPTDSLGLPGLWPDPLVPLPDSGLTLPARVNQPFWVVIRTPRSQPPGLYRGELVFTAGTWKREVPVEVRVYGFDLPDRMTCVSAFGFRPGTAFAYHGVSSKADRRAVLEMYLKVLSEHHISPYDPAPLDPYQVHWPQVDPSNPPAHPEALTVTIDWEQWVREMRRVLDIYHFNSFYVQAHGMGGGTFYDRHEANLLGFPESSAVYQRLFRSYWGQLEQRLREEGWLDYAYVYWFDEPESKDYAFVNRGFQRLKEAAPAIHRMLTEEIHEDLIGGPDIWCPLTPMYRAKEAQARQALGEKIWWYVCTGPKAPYATLFIDHPGTEMRVWLWQTWQRGIDGILVWATNYWTSPEAYGDEPQNPYKDPMSWTTGYGTRKGEKKPWGNGDGRFLYPPLAAASGRPEHPVLEPPVPSCRLEMLRDGIEDYEYFVMLRHLLRERKTELAPERRQAYEALLEVPADVSESLTAFTFDPEPLERHRDAVARAIEELMRGDP